MSMTATRNDHGRTGTQKTKGTTGVAEWAPNSFNCILGCSHNCRYCYAAFNSIVRFKRSTRNEWVNPTVREKIVRAKGKKYEGGVMFPSTHDITPEFLDPCLIVLDKLLTAGNNVLVVSKPHLECIKRICERCTQYKNQILFRFTIGSDNNDLLKYWEPGAPTYEERFNSLKLAKENGYATSISMEPMLDIANAPTIVEKLLPHVTETIWLGMMNDARSRVRIETDEDERHRQQIIDGQNKAAIIALYEKLKNTQQIRWKDSIREVVGLPPLPNGAPTKKCTPVNNGRHATPIQARKPIMPKATPSSKNIEIKPSGSATAITLASGHTVVGIDAIRVRDVDTRPLNAEHVVTLAESIFVLGLLEPIILDTNGQLLAGAHRLAALQLLGITSIKDRVKSFTDRCGIQIAEGQPAGDNDALHDLAVRLMNLGDNTFQRFADRNVPVQVIDVSSTNDATLPLAIEAAENNVRRQYTHKEIKALAERFKAAKYQTRVGRPKAGQPTMLTALQAAVGRSKRQIQRIIDDETPAPPDWDSALAALHRAAKKVIKYGANRNGKSAQAMKTAAGMIIRMFERK